MWDMGLGEEVGGWPRKPRRAWNIQCGREPATYRWRRVGFTLRACSST